ncbi:DUF3857 and transglutaminase domain-containing protein [Aquimarina sp. D1M17]|uniref:DUF3857 domain-containing protein n=1 Tax=Aquimarina acroporae TaxID=2937283 RepID=UPI0020BE214D|nr:DUF3857 domain-containing protein [Aquimarina acroporae]MCK8522259.1 DUF3857 and transglutaminase domain-containing protein [Aquimarina acroporae]
MRGKKKVIIGLLLLGSITSFSQEYKFGKVSKQELEETSYPNDGSAEAAVLYENKKVYIEYFKSQGFRLVTDVQKRIKLYNKNGFKYATDKVFLYKKGGGVEKISALKGATFNLEKGSVKEAKLKSSGIFENEYSENYNEVTFTMPALKEGSVIEYKYKILSPFFFNVDKIALQYEIPIKKIEVSFESPEYFNFKKFTSGYLSVNLNQSKRNNRIVFNSAGSKVVDAYGRRSLGNSNASTSTWNYTINKNTITSVDVPAFKVEAFSGNIENYISSISYELSSVKLPNEPIKFYATTWEDVAKTVYSSDNFGEELKKTKYFKQDIDELLNGVTRADEKVKSIYEYVKGKMTWNEKFSVYSYDGLKKAYNEGVGNSADINLMLTAMLDYAGLNALPVLVSSSDKMTPLFPTIEGFDYVITQVKLPDGKSIYLDATDKVGSFNVLPNRVILGIGRAIEEDGASEEVDLRPAKTSATRCMIQCEINDEGAISGSFSGNYSDYNAHAFSSKNNGKENSAKQEVSKKKFGISNMSNYAVVEKKSVGSNVTEKFNFTLEDQLEVIEDEIFFSPLLFLKRKENKLKSEERKYPVDFGFGYANVYILNIKVPENYQVSELPKPKAFSLPENLGSFSYNSTVSGNTIQIMVNETISSPVVASKYYKALKQFFGLMVEKENEQVVLKKI